MTEREQIDDARLRLAAIVESSDDAIVSETLDGTITSWNKGAENIYGYTAEEMIGQSTSVLVPADRHDEVPELLERIGRGERVDHYETLRLRKDGERIDVSLTISPIRSSEGTISRASVVAHDVTERKRAEERLERLASELARSNRELEEFARVASHDLQEPVRKIRTFGERLRIKRGDALGSEGRDYLERMENAARRMQALTEDLLVLARVTAETQPFESVDLGELIQDALSDMEIDIEQAGARVEVGDLPIVYADPPQMRRLLQNLVSNAIKFRCADRLCIIKIQGQAPAGDGRQPARASGPNNGMCQVLVEDNGMGFEEKYLDRIFGAFERLHGRGEYEGSGVGLAICRKIANNHGGQITARSWPGEGSTFIITLPIPQATKRRL